MTDYKISLIYMTYRPGGLDLLAASLEDQTYKNYELIIVDDYKPRLVNADSMRRYFKSFNIPIVWYGPSKEKTLKDTTYGQVNAFNTGLFHATGDIIVYCSDYTMFNSNSMERWNTRYNQAGINTLITAVAIEYSYHGAFVENLKDGHISIFDPPIHGSKLDHRFEPYHPWVPETFELFYSSFPAQWLTDINGFDERADYWCVYWFNSILKQGALSHLGVGTDHSQVAHIVDHRHWAMMDPKLWSVVKTGIAEPAPEASPQWERRSPNSFDIVEERRKLGIV